MHWNVMTGAANFVRGPTFDPVAQLVEQRTFKPRLVVRGFCFVVNARPPVPSLAPSAARERDSCDTGGPPFGLRALAVLSRSAGVARRRCRFRVGRLGGG